MSQAGEHVDWETLREAAVAATANPTPLLEFPCGRCRIRR